ncbi:MAG: DUF4349 domain-containing protein [Clostridia bacterium]|nr:DUF4349 domain-containing protein [Clostridia bacterium]
MEDMKGESIFSPIYSANGGSGLMDSAESQGEFEEKLIVTVSLRTQSKEFDVALDAIRAAVGQFGGYEENFQSSGRSYGSSESYRRSASMTIRVPAARLDDFLSEVGELVNVVNEQNSMSNATEEYYDLAARVSVLEEERAAYEAMLSKAADVEEVLIIKDRLYDVISEIESAKTRMKVIDSRASYSTVHLSLEEVVDYTTVTTPKTTFGSRISSAFTRSWKNFAEGFQDFTVWLVGAIPTILVLLVIAGAGTAIAVVSNRNLKKRLAKKKEEQEK